MASVLRRRRCIPQPRVAYSRTLGSVTEPSVSTPKGLDKQTLPRLIEPLRGTWALAWHAPRVREYATLGCGIQRLRRKKPPGREYATLGCGIQRLRRKKPPGREYATLGCGIQRLRRRR